MVKLAVSMEFLYLFYISGVTVLVKHGLSYAVRFVPAKGLIRDLQYDLANSLSIAFKVPVATEFLYQT